MDLVLECLGYFEFKLRVNRVEIGSIYVTSTTRSGPIVNERFKDNDADSTVHEVTKANGKSPNSSQKAVPPAKNLSTLVERDVSSKKGKSAKHITAPTLKFSTLPGPYPP